MTKLKIIRQGDQLGVLLPQPLLAELKAAEGDELQLEKSPAGYLLSRVSNDAAGDIVDTGLKAFERTRQKFDNAFRELAK